MPPAYSAAKVAGQRAYDLARQGRESICAAQRVHIYGIDVLNYEYPHLELEVHCGKGTYIRSLARDLGDRLGCGALDSDLAADMRRPFHGRRRCADGRRRRDGAGAAAAHRGGGGGTAARHAVGRGTAAALPGPGGPAGAPGMARATGKRPCSIPRGGWLRRRCGTRRGGCCGRTRCCAGQAGSAAASPRCIIGCPYRGRRRFVFPRSPHPGSADDQQ